MVIAQNADGSNANGFLAGSFVGQEPLLGALAPVRYSGPFDEKEREPISSLLDGVC